MGTRERIKIAFAALRREGYFARMNFMCCQTCGWAAVPKGRADKVVFYHAQDAEDLAAGRPMMMAWAGDSAVIVRAFRDAGLKVIWDGDDAKRIAVTEDTSAAAAAQRATVEAAYNRQLADIETARRASASKAAAWRAQELAKLDEKEAADGAR